MLLRVFLDACRRLLPVLPANTVAAFTTKDAACNLGGTSHLTRSFLVWCRLFAFARICVLLTLESESHGDHTAEELV